MSFWHELEQAFPINRAYLLTIPVFILVALALFALLPRERQRIRTAILVYLLSLAGLFIVAFLAVKGASPDGSLYHWIRWASLLLHGIALISIASIFLFDIILATIRL